MWDTQGKCTKTLLHVRSQHVAVSEIRSQGWYGLGGWKMLEWIINDPFVPFATESEGSQSTLSSDALNLFIPIAVLFAPTSLRYTEIH